MATADEVETSTSGSELQSTTGFETRPPSGLLKGQIVVRTSHPGGFFASEELQELLRAFLERLGDGLLQAISFAPAAEVRRLRRRLEESAAAAATDVTVSFTAEVPAGHGEEAAAKLQAPPEVAQAALEAAAAEVSAVDTIEVRSVIVTEILEETEESRPPPVAADGTWLVMAAILLSGVLLIAAAVLGICYFFKLGRNKKYAAGQGTADPPPQAPQDQAPPTSLPGDLSGPNDVQKSRSSNVITSHL